MPDSKEERIRNLTKLYYSNPEVQKAIFSFSKNREISPRYFEGFGKRPDSFQYLNDIFELVKKGATSFHCSEELWQNPLNIATGMTEKQYNELRTGWDLLFDIDSKYLDYSKIMAEIILDMLKFHGVKNVGTKFSGSKGFHLLIPWKAFPKEVNGVQTKDMFPEWPRIITQYIMHTIEKKLIERITGLSKQNKYVRDFSAPKEVVPDLILVSPRHLFRTPYSLHEKTALASVVLSKEELADFHPHDANPLKVKIKNFTPDSQENEAKELLMQALDWNKNQFKEEQTEKKDFSPIKLSKISNDLFPPSIKKILQGVADGKKRALFILLNLFRFIGMEKQEIEKRIDEWNKKNNPPLRQGYIKAQLDWSYRNKPVMPPNFDKDYYKGIGIQPSDKELRFKNPVTYMLKKSSDATFKNNSI